MITVNEAIQVPYPRRLVWSLLSVPETVVGLVEGAELIEEHEDGTYDGAITIQFGPLKVMFRAHVLLKLDDTDMVGEIHAQGKDKQASTRFNTNMNFKVEKHADPSTSLISANAEVEIKGRLAKVVETGAKLVVKRLVTSFTERLTARCEAVQRSETAV